jgi:hypothetical protein
VYCYPACVNPYQPTNISFRHFSASNPTRFHTASAPVCRVFITIISHSQTFRELPLIYDLNSTTRLVHHTAFPLQESTCIPPLPLCIFSMVQRPTQTPQGEYVPRDNWHRGNERTFLDIPDGRFTSPQQIHGRELVCLFYKFLGSKLTCRTSDYRASIEGLCSHSCEGVRPRCSVGKW